MIKSISLDTEVAKAIEQEALAEERPFSQIVNRKLREAFGIKPPSKKPARPQRPRKAIPA